MFGLGKLTCGVCGSRVARKAARRTRDGQGLGVCLACYERWDRAGRACAGCRTPVQGIQEVGVFAAQRGLGHADCGGVMLGA